MLNLTLQEFSLIAQVVLAAITFIGIVVSIFLSVRALREVQEDRRQRQRPHLAFESGGMRLPVEFVIRNGNGDVVHFIQIQTCYQPLSS